MSIEREMPKYRSHKVVHALKIKEIVENPNGTLDLFFHLNGFAPWNISSMCANRFKHTDDDLGYYVVYEDGHESWSPTKAFEEGYLLIGKPLELRED